MKTSFAATYTQAAAEESVSLVFTGLPGGATFDFTDIAEKDTDTYVAVRVENDGAALSTGALTIDTDTESLGSVHQDVPSSLGVGQIGYGIVKIDAPTTLGMHYVVIDVSYGEDYSQTFRVQALYPETQAPEDATTSRGSRFAKWYECSICNHWFPEGRGGLIDGKPCCYRFGCYEEELRDRARHRRRR